MGLCSYSRYGPAARDLSDNPSILYGSVTICPADLFAGSESDWESVDQETKSKLREFLDHPALHLSEAEKHAISGHEEAFRRSQWFDELWARTCGEFLPTNERRQLMQSRRLQAIGAFQEENGTLEDWQQELRKIELEKLIAELKQAASANWPSQDEKRIFAYLRAEFTRQAGRNAEAIELFDQVAAVEKEYRASDEADGLEWISSWAEEQRLRASPVASQPDELLKCIIPELPDPQDEATQQDPRWSRHWVAVDILAKKAVAGEVDFQAALWELLDRRTDRFTALIHMSKADFSLLGQKDSRWNDWFQEIRVMSDSEAGELKARLFESESESWRKQILLPAVRRLGANDDPFSLPVSPDGKLADSSTDHEALANELAELWKDSLPEDRASIARVLVHLLRVTDEIAETPEQPWKTLLIQLAEVEEGQNAMIEQLGQPWKSSFWKSVCAYLAGVSDADEVLITDAFVEKAGSEWIWRLLAAKHDPVWMDRAIDQLQADGWESITASSYLFGLDQPKAADALEAFAEKSKTPDQTKTRDAALEEVSLIQLRMIEERRTERRLKTLPIR
ncbi:hypothetical protein JIN85_12505 [Luteolibacter pohnpeiensis]|uniref:Uncharacterized protein n=1 Tax=Luteolibacter pohnpeiensis TaxID=454153 RepID=A0A934SC83_9BACT|nr:hypothetical protein [Luteolibacter pohnpeiensis]MBK1883239.1 hypothetical protein [Luteolibacter pohnpeiensis]